MKILHILNELKFSGAEILLESASEILGSKAQNVILSTGEHVGAYKDNLQNRGFRIIHLPFEKRPRYFWMLMQTLQREKFDIVHVHAERAAFWNECVAQACNAKVVRTVHNEFRFEGWTSLTRTIQRTISRNLGTRYVACSKRVEHNEYQRFKNKTITINNWFDPRRITQLTNEERKKTRGELGICESDVLLIAVGNYGPAKNQEAIVECVRDLPEYSRVKLIICGAGTEVMRGNVEKFPENRVFLLGAVKDVGPLLSAADIFVSTSLFEGGQLSLIEAAASGLPCITTRVGLADELSDCRDVHFIAPDKRSLENKLLELFSQTDSCTNILEKKSETILLMQEVVRDRFSLEKGALNYLNLYQEILGIKENAIL